MLHNIKYYLTSLPQKKWVYYLNSTLDMRPHILTTLMLAIFATAQAQHISHPWTAWYRKIEPGQFRLIGAHEVSMV